MRVNHEFRPIYAVSVQIINRGGVVVVGQSRVQRESVGAAAAGWRSGQRRRRRGGRRIRHRMGAFDYAHVGQTAGSDRHPSFGIVVPLHGDGPNTYEYRATIILAVTNRKNE